MLEASVWDHTPLRTKLGKIIGTVYTKVRSKFKSHHYCLWSSKAVVLILLWNLIISVVFKSIFDPSLYTVMFNDIDLFNDNDDYFLVMHIYGLPYGLNALLFLFYPLAGFLADVRWGRYTAVKNSLCFLFWSVVLMAFVAGLGMLGSTTMLVQSTANYYYESLTTTEIITIAVLCLVFGVPGLCGLMLCFSSIVTFSANVIQFGFDQLHDSPAESSTLYIHWYVWTNQVGLFLFRLPSAVFSYDFTKYMACAATSVFTLVAFILLGITLCFEKYKRHWFLIESGSTNPYKLVYKVLKFAKDHTNPIRRSAFTYCEDELPSRLDLGKEKYGGPFTTEQVENVKAFLGIVRVLMTIFC